MSPVRTYCVFETELGWVGLMRSARGICASTLPAQDPITAIANLGPAGDADAEDEDGFAATITAVRTRLQGRPAPLTEPLDLSRGTSFQQAVWLAVATIALGTTRSYGWVAETIGQPRAAHAVGQAVARNPLPILIPCHRVVASNGSLGGFGPGSAALPTKRSLLRREGVFFAGPRLEQWETGRAASTRHARVKREGT